MDELCIRLRAHDDAVALVADGRATTYRELAVEAAAWLLPTEPLTILSEPSSRALVVKLVALLDAHRPFALLHPKLSPRERAEQTAVLRTHPHLPAGTAAVLFTSGSSGQAKAVCLPRSAFVASARATAAHLGEHVLARWLLTLPLCHVGGLSVLTRALLLGTTVELAERFDPSAAYDVTGASLVPTLLRRLLRETTGSLARFGVVVVGGAGTHPDLLDAARARELVALCTYGMTETCAQVALEPFEDALASGASRSSGVALGSTELSVVDGRIHVHGPTLFSGYLGEGPPTLPFDTGDLGRIEGGRIYVDSRRTDLIVTGGENVYPLEVERALLATGLVEEAMVFGAPSEEWGQEVRALLVTGADLCDIARKLEVADHKRPKWAALVSALPTLPTGKPDRRAAGGVASALVEWPRRGAYSRTR